MAEAAIGQVGSSVQSLGSHVEQISSEQQAVLERAYKAEVKTEILVQQLQESQQEQVGMLAALEHQKAMQTQQQELLEKEIVRQQEE